MVEQVGEPVASSEQQRPRSWSGYLWFGAMLFAAWFVWSSYESRQTAELGEVNRRVAWVNQNLTRVLASASYRSAAARGLQPDLVWTGEGATVLHSVYTPAHDGQGFLSSSVGDRWEILAKTPSARFFVVSFGLREAYVACDEKAVEKCVFQDRFETIKADEIKEFVFRRYGDPVLYRSLFGEDMPPREVKA